MNRSLKQIFEEMAARTPQPETTPDHEKPQEIKHRCDLCHNETVSAAGDLCITCKREWTQGYQVMQMTGRLANGAERDHGSLFHAVEFQGSGGLSDWSRDRAMCGAQPGKRSQGWSPHHGEIITCPRCLKRLQSIERRARDHVALMTGGKTWLEKFLQDHPRENTQE